MPSKNTVKQFAPDQMYHVYNRGVDKRNIFIDETDYSVFLSYLKIALSPNKPDKSSLNSVQEEIRLRRLHLYDSAELVAFCLMPNHFHLLIYQYTEDGISQLMRSISTGYAMYFNNKYKRVGRLFQGTYKASHINSDSYWMHISRYIHLNPLDIGREYLHYPYSSIEAYTGEKDFNWVKTSKAMGSFKDSDQYKKFLSDYTQHKTILDDLKKVTAD